MKRFLAYFGSLSAACFVTLFCGCTAPQKQTAKIPGQAVQPSASAATHHPRAVLMVVPQTDDGAASWLKWFERYPQLKLVIAVSPRFARLSKEPALKAKAQALQKAGRLELALQLPNAPFLPLIVDTNSAKDAVPAGSPLPNPPYAYPDDVIQMVARAKAEYFKQWNQLPRSLVLPHGAASARLLVLFDRLGFGWLAGAFGAPSADGPFQSGNLMLWDGTPNGPFRGTAVRIWDERDMRDSGKTAGAPINEWMQELQKDSIDPILPSDVGLVPQPLPPENQWQRRTWTTTDWTLWIGSPAKNQVWEWLRRTREALESYKNSGQASVNRLDMAFEEFYTAENSNFFSGIGNSSLPPNVSEDREREFKATLSSVYRLMAQPPPDDLFSQQASQAGSVRASSTTIRAETMAGGREHVVITDAPGDSRGNGNLPEPPGVSSSGALDLRSVAVLASSQTFEWTVTFSSPSEAMVDIYVDLNNQPNVGTVALLPGRKVAAAEADAWEYALCLAGNQAYLYRTTQGGGGSELSGTFPAERSGNEIRAIIPRGSMRGSPRRWGYQALVMAQDPKAPAGGVPQPVSMVPAGSRLPPVYDLLDPLEISQADLLNAIESGKRSDLPFVRVKGTR